MEEQPEISATEAEAAIKKRFFSDVSDDEWRQRGGLGAIFTKLCKDARFLTRNDVLNLPPELGTSGDEDIYGEIVSVLAAGEVRKKGTYTTKRPQPDDRRTGGTAPIHHFPTPLFNNLMNALAQALEYRGKEPALPPVPRAKKERRHQRARYRYPDEDGKLKKAFCKGLGINPSDTNQDFVGLFRGLSRHVGAHDTGRRMWPKLRHDKTFGALVACVVEEKLLEGHHGSDFAKIGNSMSYTIRSVLVDHHVSGAEPMTEEIAEACGKVIAEVAPEKIAEYLSRRNQERGGGRKKS